MNRGSPGGDSGQPKFVSALRPTKSCDGTGGQAGQYYMPFVERLRRGNLVIHLSHGYKETQW